MMPRISKRLLPALVLLVNACASEQPPGDETGTATPEAVAAPASLQAERAPYDFERPDISFALPTELKEISGLTLLPSGHLGAVQDEAGVLFVLNRETGAVEARHFFGERGDYEGIEHAGDLIFVLRSDGALLELKEEAGETRQVRTYATALREKNDAEGLGYDAAKGRLLIACKEDPGGDLENDRKAIYAFDVASGTLEPEPVYVIDLDALKRQFGGRGAFKPSALAVHPVSGAVYVLSSAAKALVVLGEDGGLQHVWRLPEAMFEQPEGLSFLPDGTLFLASEGGEGPAMLYRFSQSDAVR